MHNARQIGNNGGGRGGKGLCEFKAPAPTERAPLLYHVEPSFLFHRSALPRPGSSNPLFIRHILFSPFDKRASTHPPFPLAYLSAPTATLSHSSTLAGCGFYVSGLIKRLAPLSFSFSLFLSVHVITANIPTTPTTCNRFFLLLFFFCFKR